MSFGTIAEDYDRLRPGPPPVAVDWLLPARRAVVVDLAAGTGLMTRALARVAGRVIAIEPDARMRSVLRARSPDVGVLAGRGEAIPLPAACADAVIVSTAWHWMDPGLAVPEIGRVLRDGGRFGVIWTSRDRATPWLRIDEWFPAAEAAPSSQAGPAGAACARGAGRDGEHREVRLPDASMFANIETEVFRFTRSMTVDDLIGMLATSSRVITATEEARAAGLARATAAIAERFPGAHEIEVPMSSRCWRADRLARADFS